jgi:hypothetical protein
MRHCRDYRSIFPLTPTEVRRLMSPIEESPDGCWLWTGSMGTGGYGRVLIRGQWWQVHRMVYELLVGPAPIDCVIHHACRNKRCCNPAHLEAATQSVNILRDIAARGGSRRPRRLKTCCANGHQYTDENTWWRLKHGKRIRACRICYEASYSRRYRKRKSLRAAEAALHSSVEGIAQAHFAPEEASCALEPEGEIRTSEVMVGNESEVLPCPEARQAVSCLNSGIFVVDQVHDVESLQARPSCPEGHS